MYLLFLFANLMLTARPATPATAAAEEDGTAAAPEARGGTATTARGAITRFFGSAPRTTTRDAVASGNHTAPRHRPHPR